MTSNVRDNTERHRFELNADGHVAFSNYKRADGVTILLVERDARLALRHADRGYVVKTGTIAMHGPSQELLADDSIRAIYLGC